MQKKLGDHFMTISSQKAILRFVCACVCVRLWCVCVYGVCVCACGVCVCVEHAVLQVITGLHTHMHTHAYTCLHTHTRTRMHTHTHAHTHTHTHTHMNRELYDVESVMLSEEASIISGILVGLNSLDYNVMMKGEAFDKTVSARGCVA